MDRIPTRRKPRRRAAGTIYPLATGKWRAQLQLESGRRNSIGTFATKLAAERALAAAIKAEQDGQAHGDSNQTVASYLTWWCEEVALKRVAPRTLTTWRGYIKNHLIPALGSYRLTKLAPHHVQSFINAEEAHPYAPRTVTQVRAILRDALADAERLQLVSRNVAKLATVPRIVHEERRVLNPDEARAFLAGIQGHPWEALYAVTIVCGLRKGEVLGLRWIDVDLERRTIVVNGSVQRVSIDPTAKWGDRTEHRRVQPKTPQSRRMVRPPASVIALIREHRVRQLQGRLHVGPVHVDHGLLFTRDDGHPMNEGSVTRELHRILDELGLPQVTFHDLRHSAASLLASLGLTLKEVSEILGHANIQTTANLYTHLFGTASEHAATALDAWYADGK